MVLEKDFKEFLELLNRNAVKYLLIGGYAVVAHGYSRYTKDMDIWVEMSLENATRIVKTLEDFGMGSLGLTEQDFLEPGTFVQIGYPPVRIDILNKVAGLDFEAAYASRKEHTIDGVRVWLIGLDDLRKNKLASGRTQDLLDYEKLGET
jgi:predicted nucleotidyltransferase